MVSQIVSHFVSLILFFSAHLFIVCIFTKREKKEEEKLNIYLFVHVACYLFGFDYMFTVQRYLVVYNTLNGHNV